MSAESSFGSGRAAAGRVPFTPGSVAGGVERSEVWLDRSGLTWLEHEFAAGRSRVMRASGPVTPDGVDVGTLNWEYGGGSYLWTSPALVYSDRDELRLYRVEPGGSPTPLTPADGDRYADGSLAPCGRWAAYVRESHVNRVEHAIVAVDLETPRPPRVLASASDFVASPRISPDGRWLAWIAWDKPRMPWDGTELWLAAIAPDLSLTDARRIAGGPSESILQPAWSPDGTLHWVSDASGWWNLYALADGGGRPVPVHADRAEYAAPPWHHGDRSYGFLSDGTIVAVRIADAVHELVRIDPGSGRAERLASEVTFVVGPRLACLGQFAAFVGVTPTDGEAVCLLNADTGALTTIARDEPGCDADAVAVPDPIWIGDVHGFLYRPGVHDTPPPLLLQLHGGPTDAARLAFDPELQLWATVGFAVLDLNYSGSTGFGSAYRHRLDGEWGRRDLADCVAAVDHLTAEGLVDPRRVYVRGASAGGYLTLRCLTGSDRFAGGAARCAIADVGMWREDAHDYESRYVDPLVGPPSNRALYADRSPARNIGSNAPPLLLVHGLADRVVPPAHTEAMAAAYRAAGRQVESLLLDGEPHALRREGSRRAWLDAELRFAGLLLG